MSDDHKFRVCGFAQHEGELLAAGDGDRAVGRLRLALRRFEELVNEPQDNDPWLEPLVVRQAAAALQIGEAYDALQEHENAERWYERALGVRAFRESERWPLSCVSHALRYLWRGEF